MDALTTYFDFRKPVPDVEWKSPWRLEQERRRAEELLAPQYIPAPRPAAVQKRKRIYEPKKRCEGCNKEMRAGTKSSKCAKCLKRREKCPCGKTLYVKRSYEDLCFTCHEAVVRALRPRCDEDGCQAVLQPNNQYSKCHKHSLKLRNSAYGRRKRAIRVALKAAA